VPDATCSRAFSIPAAAIASGAVDLSGDASLLTEFAAIFQVAYSEAAALSAASDTETTLPGPWLDVNTKETTALVS
jgi:hypothetical protein